jgi:hypothetical protein
MSKVTLAHYKRNITKKLNGAYIDTHLKKMRKVPGAYRILLHPKPISIMHLSHLPLFQRRGGQHHVWTSDRNDRQPEQQPLPSKPHLRTPGTQQGLSP